MKSEGIIDAILSDINFEGADYPYEFGAVIIKDARAFHRFLYQELPGIIRMYQELQRAQEQAIQLKLRYGAELFPSVYKNEEEAADTLKRWADAGYLTPRAKEKPFSETVKYKAQALYGQLNIPFVASVTPSNSVTGYLDDVLCIESLFVGVVYVDGPEPKPDAFCATELRALLDNGGVVLCVTEENFAHLPNALLYLLEANLQYEADYNVMCYEVSK